MKYIVAVSGGIDSVVLLDLLSKQVGEFVVAHVDHGIRQDSAEDEKFVRRLAEGYGLQFVSTRLELGSGASEEAARHARYEWLDEVMVSHGADTVITAHHEDDVLETMCINLLRGTGWRGLSSLRSTPTRIRPLLGWSKAQIVEYALSHELAWREDSTNESFAYFRNRIRSSVIPRLTAEQRQKLRGLYVDQLRLLEQIEQETADKRSLFIRENLLRRYETMMVDDEVGSEFIRQWLGAPLERKRQRELLLFLKTARTGSRWSLDRERFVLAKESGLIVVRPRG